MLRRRLWEQVTLILVLIALPAIVRSRYKATEDFPDYNHLEYAKPLPPSDQQVQEAPPGSIHQIFGNRKPAAVAVPIDALPVSLHPTQNRDESEPSMDDLFNESPST